MDSEKCDKERVTVDLIYVESVNARQERTIRRLWISNIIKDVVILFIIGLFLWLLYGSNFETYDYQQDGSGINIIGDDNEEVKQHGAESESQKDNANEQSKTDDPQGES